VVLGQGKASNTGVTNLPPPITRRGAHEVEGMRELIMVFDVSFCTLVSLDQ